MLPLPCESSGEVFTRCPVPQKPPLLSFLGLCFHVDIFRGRSGAQGGMEASDWAGAVPMPLAASTDRPVLVHVT